MKIIVCTYDFKGKINENKYNVAQRLSGHTVYQQWIWNQNKKKKKIYVWYIKPWLETDCKT